MVKNKINKVNKCLTLISSKCIWWCNNLWLWWVVWCLINNNFMDNLLPNNSLTNFHILKINILHREIINIKNFNPVNNNNKCRDLIYLLQINNKSLKFPNNFNNQQLVMSDLPLQKKLEKICRPSNNSLKINKDWCWVNYFSLKFNVLLKLIKWLESQKSLECWLISLSLM